MQRYFIEEENWLEEHITIKQDDAKHITSVMRMKINDDIICVHPDGKVAICKIQSIEKPVVHAIVQQYITTDVELPVNVTIVQGLPKGQKLDFILQKGTELGAYAFQFFTAKRSVAKWEPKKANQKLQRYEKIVKEAAEQSHRNHLPIIHDVKALGAIVSSLKKDDLILFADEEAVKQNNFPRLQTQLKEMQSNQDIYVVIGPEGGIDQTERDLLLRHGAKAIRLGPRILRTETAAMYVLANISYELEETI